jgi:uncharacterized protein YdbL (DUF1318 family)
MRRLFLLLFALASLAVPSVANGQDPATILQARRAGLIGERYDGYIGLVTANPPEALRKQVAAINIRRRSLYYDLATRKGVTREEVGITAACSLLRRIGIGEYYLPGQGGWQRVVPGRSPVPSYCG